METLRQSLVFIIGILLTSGIFYLILYFGFRRKRALLYLSLFCFLHALKAFFRVDGELAMEILGSSYRHSLEASFAVYYGGLFCLVAFMAYQFDVPFKRWVLGAFLLFIPLFYLYRWPVLPYALLSCIGISIYALRQQKLGAWLSLVGLLLLGIAGYLETTPGNRFGYFLGNIAFVATITVLVGQEIREQIRLQREALLRSSRLENQLLKKSLQPHFLFNSLTSLQEWIEIAPDRAAHFVQQLADEFRAVSKMSGKQLISIEEELAMCRAHLQIMGYRKHACFELIIDGIDGDEQVPPAIFHTLIENGLTHGYAERDRGQFRLTKTATSTGVCYTLRNDGDTCKSAAGGGTGLKYVEARLEESYPGRWSLTSAPIDGGWEVRIYID